MAHGYNSTLAGMSGTLGNLVIYQSGGQTVIRTRTFRQGGRGSAAQGQQRRAVAGLAGDWKRLTPAQQLAWMRLGARMPDWDGARGSKPLSGYQCFMAVNSGRGALGLPPLADPPDAPDLPPFLPPLTLTASATGGALSLALSCGPAPFDAPVQVFASRPALPGGPPPRVKDLVQIALLPALPAGGAAIGPAYAAKFGVPAPGLTVTVRAVPLSASGFRGQALSVSAVVGG